VVFCGWVSGRPCTLAPEFVPEFVPLVCPADGELICISAIDVAANTAGAERQNARIVILLNDGIKFPLN